jgi:phosphatidate cytidylyltransferase
VSNLISRSITGIFFVAIIVAGLLFSSITFFFLFLLITFASIWEFYSLCRMAHVKPQIYLGTAMAVLFFIFNFLYAINYINLKFFLAFIPLILLVFINELYSFNKRPFSSIAYTFLGIIYIAFPISLFNYYVFGSGISLETLITNPDAEVKFDVINNFVNYFYFLKPTHEIIYNPNILLGYFILLWLFDTAAYLSGITFGRHRLFERISPKKSWEGFLGGAILTIGASYLLSMIIKDLSMLSWMTIAAIIIVMGTYGDLVESLFKRSINIKDSGKVLPGHGGLLDRFDAVFLSAPIVFVYLQFYS